jgi:putative spermidine/putrescine transport system ATP-binding protein
MADRVAVFSQGRIEQLDTPRELYNRPQTAFVASFVGSANVVGAAAARTLTGSAQGFAIRPELIELLPPGSAVPDGHVRCAGQVLDALYHGASSRLRVRVDEHTTLTVALAEGADGAADGPAAGSTVQLAWRRAHAVPLRD